VLDVLATFELYRRKTVFRLRSIQWKMHRVVDRCSYSRRPVQSVSIV